MKKIIITILTILIIPFCFADTEVNISVITSGDMDSEINQIALGNINTDIYCEANECTTNINGGTINLPNESNFAFNDYSITNNKRSGLSLKELIYRAGRVVDNYVSKEQEKISDEWTFWEMLDYVFVSHSEFEGTKQNTYYLAEEIDSLRAENKLLRTYLNITYNEEMLECQTGIETAKRTGSKIVTKNGFMVDINAFEETCVKLY